MFLNSCYCDGSLAGLFDLYVEIILLPVVEHYKVTLRLARKVGKGRADNIVGTYAKYGGRGAEGRVGSR